MNDNDYSKRMTCLFKNYELFYRRYLKKDRTIAEIENVYNRLDDAMMAYYKDVQAPIVSEIFNNGGFAHCIPNNSAQNDGSYWRYEVTDEQEIFGKSERFLAFSFDWVIPPEKMINSALGQKLYNITKRGDVLENRMFKFKDLLKNKLLEYLNKNYPVNRFNKNNVKDFNINGRHYIFFVRPLEHGYVEWAELSWKKELNVIKL